MRPSSNSIYGVHNPKGIKLLCRLRLGLSHLREHKFKHNFQDTLNPLCPCDVKVESSERCAALFLLFQEECSLTPSMKLMSPFLPELIL